MRSGAGIIVAIGVCIGSLIVLERSTGPELKRIEAQIRITKEHMKELEEERDGIEMLRGFFWILNLAAIIFLTAWFVKVSRGEFRRPFHYVESPIDEFDIMCRLSDHNRLPFQFGTLSLLALMLAVAIVCSAIVYPLKK